MLPTILNPAVAASVVGIQRHAQEGVPALEQRYLNTPIKRKTRNRAFLFVFRWFVFRSETENIEAKMADHPLAH